MFPVIGTAPREDKRLVSIGKSMACFTTCWGIERVREIEPPKQTRGWALRGYSARVSRTAPIAVSRPLANTDRV